MEVAFLFNSCAEEFGGFYGFPIQKKILSKDVLLTDEKVGISMIPYKFRKRQRLGQHHRAFLQHPANLVVRLIKPPQPNCNS